MITLNRFVNIGVRALLRFDQIQFFSMATMIYFVRTFEGLVKTDIEVMSTKVY